jgi:hypothetical protein
VERGEKWTRKYAHLMADINVKAARDARDGVRPLSETISLCRLLDIDGLEDVAGILMSSVLNAAGRTTRGALGKCVYQR